MKKTDIIEIAKFVIKPVHACIMLSLDSRPHFTSGKWPVKEASISCYDS